MIGNKKGYTLTEVLVVSVILVLLIGGISSFFIFGQKIYAKGYGQANLHHSVRFAVEQIGRELRYANDMSLMPADWSPEQAQTSQFKYIYFDEESKRVMMLDSTGSYQLSDPVITDFQVSKTNKILQYTLVGKRGSVSFTLAASVNPLNLFESIQGEGESSAIAFMVPNPGSAPEADNGNPNQPENPNQGDPPDPDEPEPEEPEPEEPPDPVFNYPEWSASAVYTGGNKVTRGGRAFQATYWTQNNDPLTNSGPQGSGKPWFEIFN